MGAETVVLTEATPKLPGTADALRPWQLRTRLPGPYDERIHPEISYCGVVFTEWTVVYGAVRKWNEQHDQASGQFLRTLWESSFRPVLSRLDAFQGCHSARAHFLLQKALGIALEQSAEYRFAPPLNASETYMRTCVDYLWSRINWLD